ncbi:hypothetical protein PBRA_004013 [Plasmodiophora brassicae]|uniref:Uncharacterized protein n=1 Tax=Plasmodiophora brassicae TaxID=37360 RepID=A0A0G4IJJ2_PLABS|nr:hypothetical protein PBRA_004013 [Plasmodiophora brassicae]
MTDGASSGYDYLFKLLLVGDSGVGSECWSPETNILLSFTGHSFETDIKSTIGVDLKLKILKLRNKTIKLTLWDTAGQERFRTLTSAYYRGAQGIVLVYDVTRRQTFQNIQEWIKEVDLYTTTDSIVKMLVGNKIDLEGERQVSKEDGRQFAKENGMLFIETSARTNVGVANAFEELVLKILDSPALTGTSFAPSGRLAITTDGGAPESSSCAC